MKRRLVEHSWEQPAPHAWEVDPDEDSEASDADPSPLECVTFFLSFLIDLYMSGALSARSFCVIVYWASGFCDSDDLRKYGMAPGKASGSYARHLKGLLGFKENEQHLFRCRVPIHARHAMERSVTMLPVLPGHEALDREVRADPTVSVKLKEAVDSGNLPRAYYDHPVVQDSELPVLPCSLYIDAVPYSNTDSVVGFWLHNLITGTRHLMVTFRKRLACKCGCKGWCSFDPLFRFIHWVVASMASGTFPNSREDGLPWDEGVDDRRKDLAGKAMKLRACLLYVVGDWAEYCSTLGFPQWNSVMRPCLFCNSSRALLFRTTGMTPTVFPHRLNRDADYVTAAARCEIRVSLTRSQHASLVPLLKFDKRRQGHRGLALTTDVTALGLRTGDRVEPSAALRDIGLFFELDVFPAEVVFWRSAEETLVLHRNPLWDERLGVMPARVLTVDILHTLHLGLFAHWCRLAVWRLLDSNAWAPQGMSAEERVSTSVSCMRNELDAWYKSHPAEGESFTRVHELTVKMFGTKSDPSLKLSGAETWGFLKYLLWALQRYSAKLRGDWQWIFQSGQKLEALYVLLQDAGMNPADHALAVPQQNIWLLL